MVNHLPLRGWQQLLVCAAFSLSYLGYGAAAAVGQARQGQAQQSQAPQEEKKDTEIPKPPKDDFTVQVYKALDEQKVTELKTKGKYKHDKSEEEVEIVLSYFNWAVADDDYWNRQITIATKTDDGFVVEKIVKSGFGELGYVKPGDTKTQDVYRKETITVTGDQATATMADADIGPAEKERFHKLLEKMVLKK